MRAISNLETSEIIDVDDADLAAWNDTAIELGWSDGMPLLPPTETAVKKFLESCRGDNEPFGPISPRQVTPTLQSLAANAVMAGCKPEYFPVVLSALRGVLAEEYNLHGTLATTHPCAPMIMVNGPLRTELEINCGSNCFGQGWRANATIGRALGLILMNVGGAKPGVMDRSTQGSPAKYTFCFGENQEESPWEPFHVRRGFSADDSVVTVMAGEPPHNINDHASTSGKAILTTVMSVMAQSGANTVYGKGPCVLVFGPEHAATLHRDKWTPDTIKEYLWEHARIPVANVSPENQAMYAETGRVPINGAYTIGRTTDDIHVAVAGGAGKHSSWIPSFGGTAVVSVKVKK